MFVTLKAKKLALVLVTCILMTVTSMEPVFAIATITNISTMAFITDIFMVALKLKILAFSSNNLTLPFKRILYIYNPPRF